MAKLHLNYEKVKDIITILIIPLMIWVVSAIVEFKTTQIKIEQHAEKIEEAEEEIASATKAQNETSVQIAKLETGLDIISKDLVEIKRLLSLLAK
jgi:septal ring factor EnvC (AmiA/AmiB activator)|tara:strand:- start:5 stop:289 length:285 start_codon:yes stop_codon:yes gene_type:complete